MYTQNFIVSAVAVLLAAQANAAPAQPPSMALMPLGVVADGVAPQISHLVAPEVTPQVTPQVSHLVAPVVTNTNSMLNSGEGHSSAGSSGSSGSNGSGAASSPSTRTKGLRAAKRRITSDM